MAQNFHQDHACLIERTFTPITISEFGLGLRGVSTVIDSLEDADAFTQQIFCFFLRALDLF